jgi:hypothetical protein
MLTTETQHGYAEQLRSETKRKPMVGDPRLAEQACAHQEDKRAQFERAQQPWLLNAIMGGGKERASVLLRKADADAELYVRARGIAISVGQADRLTPPQDEEQRRWSAYLAGLENDVSSGRLSKTQWQLARGAWTRGVRQTPRLRPPTAGLNADGDYYFDWSYKDLHGLTLSLTFLRDGRVDWFFRDKLNKVVAGSDEPVAGVPHEVYAYLGLFLR